MRGPPEAGCIEECHDWWLRKISMDTVRLSGIARWMRGDGSGCLRMWDGFRRKPGVIPW